MEAKNEGLEDDFPFQGVIFRFHVSFQGWLCNMFNFDSRNLEVLPKKHVVIEKIEWPNSCFLETHLI